MAQSRLGGRDTIQRIGASETAEITSRRGKVPLPAATRFALVAP
jgi:hypothetical protein